MFKKILSLTIIVCFFLTSLGSYPQAYADSFLDLPAPGSMVNLSPAFVPVLIKGVKVHPDNPLLFDFILDTGNSRLKINSAEFKAESQNLIKYFLAALTIKEDDLWVNLSPYEKDRIIPQDLGQTEMGRDMLAQDYILKQLTASLIYPERDLGKKFWDNVYTKARQMYGVTNIPVNSFNKVWIVADKAKVLERNNAGYVVGAHLKVMLEEDYLALNKHLSFPNAFVGNPGTSHTIASQVIRSIILPELEKEVNQGQHFAPLRQMFYSMILATWYKQTLKNALLNQVYSNRTKTSGVLSDDPSVKEKIYQQYLKAYKKGVFNYIKEDLDEASQQTVPRKYFSGGLRLGVNDAMKTENFLSNNAERLAMDPVGNMAMVTVRAIGTFKPNLAMVSERTIKIRMKITGPSYLFYPRGGEKGNIKWVEHTRQDLVDAINLIEKEKKEFLDTGTIRVRVADGLARDIMDEAKRQESKIFFQPRANSYYIYLEENKRFFNWLEQQKMVAEGPERMMGNGELEDAYRQSIGKVKALPFDSEKGIMSFITALWIVNGMSPDEILEERNLLVKKVMVFQQIVPASILMADGMPAQDALNSISAFPTTWGNIGEQMAASMFINKGKLSLNEVRTKIRDLREILKSSIDYGYAGNISAVAKLVTGGVMNESYAIDFVNNLSTSHGRDIIESGGMVALASAILMENGVREASAIDYAVQMGHLFVDRRGGQRRGLEYGKGEILAAAIFMGHMLKRDESTNKAMASTSKSNDAMKPPGGIDLNAKDMGLDIAREGNGINMKFDPAMIAEFQKGNFTGVEGIIISIVPINSPLPALGLQDSRLAL